MVQLDEKTIILMFDGCFWK